MKNLILICFLLTGILACNNAPSNSEPTDNGGSQDHPDLVAINDVIHGFYAWYDVFQKDETRNLNFTTEKGGHLALDLPKLDQFYANLRASGFISDEFIDNDRAVLKKCETLWQNEELGDVPSCLDADRFFCAQDWDLEFWTKAPIAADGLDTDRSTATMSGTEGESAREQKFELKKENGKWLITRIYCELM